MKFDHLYIGQSTAEFEKTLQKYPPSQEITHEVVKTTDDSWEGLYLRFQDQTYFEFLKDRRINQFGIGFCSETPMEFGPPIEVKSNSHLNWKHGTCLRSNGKFWFNYFSLVNYRGNTDFNFWIMQFSCEGLKKRWHNRPSSLKKIEEVKLAAPYSLKGAFYHSSSFFQNLLVEQDHQSKISLDNGTNITLYWQNEVATNPVHCLGYHFTKA